MSTQENGQAANISGHLPASVNIVSSTAANPTQITATAHGLTDQDTVDIKLHQTNTGANGQYVATVTGANTFTIPVDTSAGSPGGATGIVQSLAIGPTFAIPADGDVINAASVNVASEAQADRTAYLNTLQGSYKITDVDDFSYTDDTDAVWDYFTLTADNTWTALNSGVAIITFATAINHNDLVRFDFDCNIHYAPKGPATNTTKFDLALFASISLPGVAYSALFRVPGSSRAESEVCVAAGNDNVYTDKSFRGFLKAGTGSWPAGNGYSLKLYLQAQTVDHTTFVSLSPGSIAMIGDYTVRITVLRPTGAKQ